MSFQIKHTRDLLQNNLKLKMLIYGGSGMGKTTFCATAPNAVIAAAETGHGRGLLSVAQQNVAYVEIETLVDLETFCSGHNLDSFDTLVIDGLSYLADNAIKNFALSIPRARGESPKRKAGVPELDDYGTIGEVTRRLLAKILQLDKHIIVTTLLDGYQPAQLQGDNPKPEKMGGPDLSGQLKLGACAMFDVVMRLYVRPKLKTPGDANSRYWERVFQTVASDQYIAKSRLKSNKVDLYPPEVVFDPDKGTGTFQWFLEQATRAYSTPLAAGAAQ